MNIKIDPATYDDIVQIIHSAESPVGIDAQKTHVLILQKLLSIEKKLHNIEEKLNRQ